MLKGQVFANQLFENQMFALFIDTFANGTNGVSNNYKNGMAVTYSGSNVTIDSGAILIQGRLLEEDTSTTISAGADNMYCKLIIEIDLDKTNTTTEFNQGAYKIIKGANAYPALTQTNIVKNNAGVYQYELARFRNPSTGITDFQDMRTFIDFEDIYEEIRQHIQAIDDESIFVLKSGTASLSGAVTGSASFDSSSNLSINTTLPTYTSMEARIDSLDPTDGYFTIQFRRTGNVVQVEVYGNIADGRSTIIATLQQYAIPDWAKPSYGSVEHMTPLVVMPFVGNYIDYSWSSMNIFQVIKMVNGTYRIGGGIKRTETTGGATFHAVGTYIV